MVIHFTKLNVISPDTPAECGSSYWDAITVFLGLATCDACRKAAQSTLAVDDGQALRYKTAKEVKGTAVRLLKDISNRGGEIFKAGSIMYIVDKWKGWTLSYNPNGGWAIRCVSEREFEVLPNTVYTPTGGSRRAFK